MRENRPELLMRRWCAVLALLTLTFLIPTRSAAQPAPLNGMADYIESARVDWEIPGLGFAVVKDGEIVYATGFGVKDLRTGEPVDEHTLFAIGSASKAFTAAALAKLVDDGKLSWDDPATQYLPGFQVYDPYVTRELTVRDLVTHRSGLNRGDGIWSNSGFDSEEILYRLRYMEPTSSLRSEFGYNNNMFLAAGKVIESITGMPWDEYVDREFFTPLGMERTVSSTIPLSRIDNVAQPHTPIDGVVTPIEYRNIDNIGPAGSINSSVREMADWIRLHLANGEFDGRRLLSETQVAELFTPQTIVRREGRWVDMSPKAHFMAYGIGWFLNDYRGRMAVHHGGNIDGMHALVGMMPEEDLGVVILTNHAGNALTYALMYRVFDAYTGGEQTDWSALMLTANREAAEQREAQQRNLEASRVAGTSPALPLEDYTGTFRNMMFGDLLIRLDANRLILQRGPATGELEHWHHDTFRVNWTSGSRGSSFVTFHIDATPAATGVELRGYGDFKRMREAESR